MGERIETAIERARRVRSDALKARERTAEVIAHSKSLLQMRKQGWNRVDFRPVAENFHVTDAAKRSPEQSNHERR